jgi:hypothetical protein
MSAPMIIPFNFQPVNTGATTGTYTVPAGKYAYINLSSSLLPILNGVNLYVTRDMFPAYRVLAPGNNTYYFPLLATNIHRVNLQNSVGGAYYGYIVNGDSYDHITLDFLLYTSHIKGTGSTSVLSYLFPARANPSGILIRFTSGAINLLTADICNVDNLWLKAGDVVSQSAGLITYQEYNVIS